jgi:hypothetical protein
MAVNMNANIHRMGPSRPGHQGAYLGISHPRSATASARSNENRPLGFFSSSLKPAGVGGRGGHRLPPSSTSAGPAAERAHRGRRSRSSSSTPANSAPRASFQCASGYPGVASRGVVRYVSLRRSRLVQGTGRPRLSHRSCAGHRSAGRRKQGLTKGGSTYDPRHSHPQDRGP